MQGCKGVGPSTGTGVGPTLATGQASDKKEHQETSAGITALVVQLRRRFLMGSKP